MRKGYLLFSVFFVLLFAIAMTGCGNQKTEPIGLEESGVTEKIDPFSEATAENAQSGEDVEDLVAPNLF